MKHQKTSVRSVRAEPKKMARTKNRTMNNKKVRLYKSKRAFSFKKLGIVASLFSIVGVIFLIVSHAASPSVSGGDYFGINMGHMEWGNFTSAQVDAALTDAKNAGAHWVRMNAQWSDIQANGPTSWNWAGTDKVISSANAHGLKVLATLTYSPKWAIPTQYQSLTSKGQWELYAPANVNDFATFAKTAAQHYSAEGVHYYEIWNEANCYFWKPQPDPAYYTSLLKAAYPAIKSVDSGAVVISSGLAPYGSYPAVASDGSCINPLKFVQDMYANGAKGSFDALGWHPYNWNSGSPTQAVSWNGFYQMYGTNPNAVGIMAANGESKKIWMTEFGYPVGSDATNSVTYNNESLQAQYLTQGYNTITKASWAGPMFWYNWQDSAFGTSESFGLNRSDGSHRPAWNAFLAAEQAASPDTQAPTNVRVINPSPNLTVKGLYSFDAGADDNVGVTKVEYYVDGNFIGTAGGTQFGWILSNWDTTQKSDGNHTVFIRAYDAAGHVTQSPSITFAIANQPATSNTGGSSSGGSSTSSGGSMTGSTTGTITNPNGPPVSSVTIGSSPNPVPVAGNVSLSAPISNPANVSKVEYDVDGKPVCTADSGNFGCNIDTSKLSNGDHTITTKVFNKDGSVQTKSQQINVKNALKLWQHWWAWSWPPLILLGYLIWRFRNNLPRFPHFPRFRFGF